ncbi:MAG: pyridoxamine 5'-phosphate oxidase family protein [Candidatus Binatia bacterium]
MSQLLGKELTEDLLDRLKGNDIASQDGKAILLVTVDEKGWPHPAMISYYELVAKDKFRLNLAIGKSGTTAKNLRRTGKVTLVITDKGVNYYLKGNARQIREAMSEAPFVSLFRIELEQLLEDQDPDAMITGGITFQRAEKKDVDKLIETIFQGVRREP